MSRFQQWLVPRRRPPRQRRSACIVWSVVAALVLPGLGPLPWALAENGGDAHAAVVLAQHFHGHAEEAPHHHGAEVPHHPADEAPHHHGEEAPHYHGAPSDVPGSPTHPLDHNCLACQVLAHLARGVLGAPSAAAVVDPPASFAPLAGETLAAFTSQEALLPPARGPPPLRV